MTEMKVIEAVVEEKDGVLSAAFSDGTGHLILTLETAPDLQAQRLGLTGLHLEYSDQSRSGHGLVASVARQAETVIIRTTGQAGILGIPAVITLRNACTGMDEKAVATLDRMLTS